MTPWKWNPSSRLIRTRAGQSEGGGASSTEAIHILDLTDQQPADDLRSVAIRGGIVSDRPSWLPESRVEFLRRVDALRGPSDLWIWPMSGGAISDVPSLLSFLRARPSWKFILDPVSMLTPALLPRLTDHMRRLFEALGTHDQIGATLICSCEVEADELIHRPAPWNGRFDEELARYRPVWQAGPVIEMELGDFPA